MDDEHEVGENGADGANEPTDAGSTAGAADASRRLEPVRPWLLQGAKPAAQSPTAADLEPGPASPAADEWLRPLDPPRPWLKQKRSTEQPPKSPSGQPQNVPQPPGARSRVLDPTRPWIVQKLALPDAPAAKITPTPSNPASVLQPLVEEIEAAANGGQGGRRRIFGRRKAAGPSLPSEARHAVAPGAATWPIAFESDELAASARDSLSRPVAQPGLPADLPSAGAEPDAHAGRVRSAAQWLFERAPEPVDEVVAEPSASVGQPQLDVEPEADIPDQPSAAGVSDEPVVAQVSPGSDLARRLSALSPEPAAAEADEEVAGGLLHGLFHRRGLTGPADQPAVVPTPPSVPLRPTIAWDDLRAAPVAEPGGPQPPLEREPVPADAAVAEPLPEPEPEPRAPEPEPQPGAPEPAAAAPEPEPAVPEPEPAGTGPEPAAAQVVRPRPRPRPYASAPRLDRDAPPLSATATEPRLLVRSAALASGAGSSPGTDRDEPAKLVKGGPDRTRKNLRWLVRTAVMLLIAVIAAVLLRVFVVAPYYIPSASMEPTLHGCQGCNNDHVLVDKLSYRMHDIHRGDVVVFNRPSTWQVSEKTLIKRVVGLPGDTLKVSNGKLFVNGLEIEEPYLNAKCPPMSTLAESPAKSAKTFGPIPDGEVYVMGDNRCDSSDSRAFGPVPDSKVIGRAFVIIWPLGRIHYL